MVGQIFIFAYKEGGGLTLNIQKYGHMIYGCQKNLKKSIIHDFFNEWEDF